ncbi:acetoacetyl-CoA reductase [Corticibacter populi]|uniref:Acetoacetyl-CoA reductase n=1 Tax=Corticibacter populi TaxID=1550736 RepID=A0A3M6QZA2_9BURK|nr:acetoacetyl-CoA reductase [Corticibacter populi]RMX08298.1 acetoacetyl-CoA reductase [Corticibacter populi]RZS35580.1 3-oxoacyl-[acyl-carrier-protein] reductase [Corticibacter populi]
MTTGNTAAPQQRQRVALVTGALGGLGTAIARALHDAGHRVLASDLPEPDKAEAWLKEQAQEGYAFTFYGADVSEFDSTQAMANQVFADGHEVDILINNAGITRDASFRKLSKEAWDAVLRTNLDSLFNVTKPFIDGMVGRGWGRVINISSVNGSKGQFGQTNYSSAKSGIYGFTKSLALEVARKGVTVNAISPGYLATQMVEAVPKEVLEGQILPGIPVGRLGRPEHIAALVAFVASDLAEYMTGSNVAINGGLHMY